MRTLLRQGVVTEALTYPQFGSNIIVPRKSEGKDGIQMHLLQEGGEGTVTPVLRVEVVRTVTHPHRDRDEVLLINRRREEGGKSIRMTVCLR